jgi:hypothetical protein
MKLTDWLALVPVVQNGWTLTALNAVPVFFPAWRIGNGGVPFGGPGCRQSTADSGIVRDKSPDQRVRLSGQFPIGRSFPLTA